MAHTQSVSEGLTTPCAVVACHNSQPLSLSLWNLGADVNATSPIIGSPLHVACADNIPNRLEILSMLLERGADPNLVIRSDEGPALRPVLAEYVASNENPSVQVVALLLKYGARVVIKTQFRDPHGILNSLQNTANKPRLLKALLEAAESFDPCMIRRSSSLTDRAESAGNGGGKDSVALDSSSQVNSP